MFLLICLLGLSCQISFSLAGLPIPVLLRHSSFENPIDDKNGLNIPAGMNQKDFTEMLNNKLEKYPPPMLIFLKDDFCVEDFANDKKSLQSILNMKLWKYSAAVESPLAALKSLSFYNQSTKKEVDSISHGEMVIRPISNLDEIPEVYKNVKDQRDLFLGIMGDNCTRQKLERVRRSTDENNATDISLIVGRISFWMDQVPWIKTSKDGSYRPLGQLVSSNVAGNGTEETPLTLELSFQNNEQLKFNFFNQRGYWTLRYITYIPKEGNHTNLSDYPRLEFPHNFSYHCSVNNIYLNKPPTPQEKPSIFLNISSIQVQIDAKDGQFGESYDCVGFISIPIWTGLLVTGLLGLILIWGLIMMMDIRTMDRFDDSKGKTITISASE